MLWKWEQFARTPTIKEKRNWDESNENKTIGKWRKHPRARKNEKNDEYTTKKNAQILQEIFVC